MSPNTASCDSVFVDRRAGLRLKENNFAPQTRNVFRAGVLGLVLMSCDDL